MQNIIEIRDGKMRAEIGVGGIFDQAGAGGPGARVLQLQVPPVTVFVQTGPIFEPHGELDGRGEPAACPRYFRWSRAKISGCRVLKVENFGDREA